MRSDALMTGDTEEDRRFGPVAVLWGDVPSSQVMDFPALPPLARPLDSRATVPAAAPIPRPDGIAEGLRIPPGLGSPSGDRRGRLRQRGHGNPRGVAEVER
jgi:hypothetical protein